MGLSLCHRRLCLGEAEPEIQHGILGAGPLDQGQRGTVPSGDQGHPKRRARNVHQVIISHVQEHSRKPDEARRRIEALMGDVPRVELFARRPAPGWDVWGNEVESTIDWVET